MAILQCAVLVRKPGVVVSRIEILKAVWGSVDADPQYLDQAVSRLRIALGDDARASTIVQTAYAEGYRFAAQVVRAQAAGQPSGQAVQQIPQNTHAAFDDKDRAAILLAEYDSLRAEYAAAPITCTSSWLREQSSFLGLFLTLSISNFGPS
jgi:DNA-binding winged helix-turn-helix (wHTH) protein